MKLECIKKNVKQVTGSYEEACLIGWSTWNRAVARAPSLWAPPLMPSVHVPSMIAPVSKTATANLHPAQLIT